MRTNIDEIVESVLPEFSYARFLSSASDGWYSSRALLKQALTEKKLCVPLSEEEIRRNIGGFFTGGIAVYMGGLAKAIYQAQFGGIK